MKLSEESKKRIIEAYIGDLHWLGIIREEVAKYRNNELSKSDLEYDYEEFDKVVELISTLISMNDVVIDTETLGSLEKYYDKAHELYAEMKVDLIEMLGISDMWEEI